MDGRADILHIHGKTREALQVLDVLGVRVRGRKVAAAHAGDVNLQAARWLVRVAQHERLQLGHGADEARQRLRHASWPLRSRQSRPVLR